MDGLDNPQYVVTIHIKDKMFQAKTDYGFDLGDQLAEKAVGQLSYEIDTEVCQLLIDNANQDGDLVWSKTLPVGVTKTEHYKLFVA